MIGRRRRKQRNALIMLAVSLVVGIFCCNCLLAQDEEPELQLTETESAMIAELNAFRARSGLPAVVPTLAIMERARGHARWMASAHSMTHSSGIQENIAMGQRTTGDVQTAWVNSSGHNANMRTHNREVGVGYAVSSNGTPFWVQQFATGSAHWGGRAAEATVAAATLPVRATANFVSNHRRGLFGRRRG